MSPAELEAERDADRIQATAALTNTLPPPSAAEAAEFNLVFNRINSVVRSGAGGSTFSNLFDTDRMNAEFGRVALLDEQPTRRTQYFKDETAGLIWERAGWSLILNEVNYYERQEIRHIQWSADRKEVVVIVSHYSIDDVRPFRKRWWFIKSSGNWKIYDIESLEKGFRTLHAMAELAAPEYGDHPTRIQSAIEGIQSAGNAIFRKKNRDLDEAERILARDRDVRLPSALAADREFIEGTLKTERGDHEAALRHFDAAARLYPKMPILNLWRAIVHFRLNRFEETLVCASAFLTELGPELTASGYEAAALETLGRNADAVAAYRKALDEDSDNLNALHGLRRTLPDGPKTELTNRLLRSSKPLEMLDALLREARANRDREGIKALMTALRKLQPDDPRLFIEELRDQLDARKFSEAADYLRRKLPTSKPADRTQLLNAYLFAMIGEKKLLEAYSAIPRDHAAEAFRILAEDQEEDLHEGDLENPSPAAAVLRQLIDAHRKRDPRDPWLSFYEGALHQSRKEYEKAERQFAEGMKSLEKRPEPVDAESDERSALESFRSRRVTCLYEMKQGPKAYADVGPAAATFRQLAYRYDNDKDAEGLEALIALHHEDFPFEPALKFWRAEVHYLRTDYAAAAKGFQEYRNAAGEKAPESYRVADRWIRSLIRAKDLVQARRAVAEVGSEQVAASLRAAIEALAGNVDQVERLMAEQSKLPAGLWSFYGDEDFIRLTDSEKYAELRKRFPDPRPKRPNAGTG